MKFSIILFGLYYLLKITAFFYPSFRERCKQRNLIAQIKIADDSRGRFFIFSGGKIKSKSGIHNSPDICMAFKDETIAVNLLVPPVNYQHQIDAQKEFNLTMLNIDRVIMFLSKTSST